MRPIPKKLLNEILSDPFYQKCVRHDEGTCQGRITLEHAFIYGGRQINEKWAIVPVCAYHHAVDQFQDNGDLDKDYNQYSALQRVDFDEIEIGYPRKDWRGLWRYLESKYGKGKKT